MSVSVVEPGELMRRCEQCNVEIHPKPYSIRQGQGRFCSVLCANWSKSTRALVTATCETCGVSFSRRCYTVERADGTLKTVRFCSRACTSSKQLRTCEKCGGQFTVQRYRVLAGTARFCSVRCMSGNGARAEAVCIACGVTFSRKASQFTRKDGTPRTNTYCSWACLTRRIDRVCETCHQTYNTKRTMNYRWCSRKCQRAAPRTLVDRTCQTCEKAFQVNPDRARRGQGLFCSVSCRAIAKELPAFTLVCQWCKRDYELRGDQGYWRDKRKFCSPECRVSGTGKTSALEEAVALILKDLGVTHEPQYAVGRLIVDFYVPQRNLIIEAKGCYWHACPDCKLPHIRVERRERDQRREGRLKRLGYQLAVVWQHHFKAGQAEQIIREALAVVD